MTNQEHPYVGMWVIQDGHIRHHLLPNGRYDEGRGRIQSAYRGRYSIEGNHIEYVDDTGFTADGDFIEGCYPTQGWYSIVNREERNIKKQGEGFPRPVFFIPYYAFSKEASEAY